MSEEGVRDMLGDLQPEVSEMLERVKMHLMEGEKIVQNLDDLASQSKDVAASSAVPPFTEAQELIADLTPGEEYV